MPTDTKEIAPKRFFTDLVSCSIFSARVVSAKIEPIMERTKRWRKAAYVAKQHYKAKRQRYNKQCSSLINDRIILKMVGIKKYRIQTREQERKPTQNSLLAFPLLQMYDLQQLWKGKTNNNTATRSSITRTPVTIPANF